jgi:hypothetical protein
MQRSSFEFGAAAGAVPYREAGPSRPVYRTRGPDASAAEKGRGAWTCG